MNDSQEDKVKSAPNVFGNLFGTFIGIPASLFLLVLAVCKTSHLCYLFVFL